MIMRLKPPTATPRATPYLLAGLAVVVMAAPIARGDSAPDPVADGADWIAPDYSQIRARAVDWLAGQSPEAEVQRTADALWSQPPVDEAELLERLARTFALVDDRAAELVSRCGQSRPEPLSAGLSWLTDADTPPWMADNLRLLLGRRLIRQRMYDEALDQIGSLRPDDVVAPATLLFHQAVAYHQLLQRDEAIQAIDRLLAGGARPQRYSVVAKLMREDLGRLQDESLDHIARRMRDIHRRLDLGRANRQVREIEDGVIESLDKLIEKLEKQQQQGAGSGQSGGPSGSPAPDSRILGGKGPGHVTRRTLKHNADWGSLPPKEREEALQQIGRDFPSHYRDVIEEYFRRKAAEGSQP